MSERGRRRFDARAVEQRFFRQSRSLDLLLHGFRHVVEDLRELAEFAGLSCRPVRCHVALAKPFRRIGQARTLPHDEMFAAQPGAANAARPTVRLGPRHVYEILA